MNTFKQYKILYVDDEEHNLVAFKATFRRYYTIFTAKNAEEGFDILKKEKICLPGGESNPGPLRRQRRHLRAQPIASCRASGLYRRVPRRRIRSWA